MLKYKPGDMLQYCNHQMAIPSVKTTVIFLDHDDDPSYYNSDYYKCFVIRHMFTDYEGTVRSYDITTVGWTKLC